MRSPCRQLGAGRVCPGGGDLPVDGTGVMAGLRRLVVRVGAAEMPRVQRLSPGRRW